MIRPSWRDVVVSFAHGRKDSSGDARAMRTARGIRRGTIVTLFPNKEGRIIYRSEACTRVVVVSETLPRTRNHALFGCPCASTLSQDRANLTRALELTWQESPLEPIFIIAQRFRLASSSYCGALSTVANYRGK